MSEEKMLEPEETTVVHEISHPVTDGPSVGGSGLGGDQGRASGGGGGGSLPDAGQPHAPVSVFYGACDVGPHPSWLGPNRATKVLAQRDCDKHNATWVGHEAAVIE